LRKKKHRCVTSISQSVHMEQLGFHWTDFRETWYLKIFRKSMKNIQVSSKTDKYKGTSDENLSTLMIISRRMLLRMRDVSDKICREKSNTRFIFNNCFSHKSCRLWDNVEKYCRAGQAADDNMAHAHCMLDN